MTFKFAKLLHPYVTNSCMPMFWDFLLQICSISNTMYLNVNSIGLLFIAKRILHVNLFQDPFGSEF